MVSIQTFLLGIILCGLASLSQQSYLTKNYPATVIEDGKLDTANLIRKYGYPVEEHFATTEDGYILGMHRMPRTDGRPVFLMHGLTDSSGGWVIMGPWSGLAYYFYAEGYDVWMGNARGNRYSRNHTTKNPNVSSSFWGFSWHEIGYYDLPTMIDYVLNTTGYSKLGYFGHSQGTTSFWVMTSSRPEYNEKIAVMGALAPVAFMKHMKTPLINIVENFLSTFKNVVSEVVPHSDMYTSMCFPSKMMEDVCAELLMQILGKDMKSVNFTMLPTILGHVPAGCGLKQFQHYLQLQASDRFSQYNYGPAQNMKIYGTSVPPDYPLRNINAPVALYYAQNDYLSSVEDVQRLMSILPNVVEDHLYPYREWNHVSMIWGLNARKLAHEHMLELLGKYHV